MSQIKEIVDKYCRLNAVAEHKLGRVKLARYIQSKHPELGAFERISSAIRNWVPAKKNSMRELIINQVNASGWCLEEDPSFACDTQVEASAEEVKEPYRVSEDGKSYILKDGKFSFSVDFVDRLFYEYSEHGLNKSTTQVRLDNNLNALQWNAIWSSFDLRKASNIFSPYTWDNTPAKDREAMLDKKLDALYENTGALLYKQYNDKTIKKAREIIQGHNKRKALEEEYHTLLAEYFVKHQVVQIPRTFKAKGDIEHIVVKIADTHLGAETNDSNGTILTLHYSPDVLQQKLGMAAREVNSYNAKKVTVVFLGDLIESFTGLNHPNSFKGMAKNSQGAQAIIGAHSMMVEFLQQVNNVVEIIGVGGNHDRGTSSNKEDDQAWIAETVFHFLSETYRGSVPVKFHSFLISTEINGIHYIFTHGDSKAVEKKDRKSDRMKKSQSDSKFEFIYQYGNNKMFNLICTGHFHSRGIKADQIGHRHIVCPSVFTGNLYAERLGYTSLPGIMVSYNNGRGYPKVDDIPLM